MTLKKGVYDFTKWVALIFLPAVGTLYVGVAAIWELKYTTQVTNSIIVADAFLGAIVGISSKGYTPLIDGHVYVNESTPEFATARIEFSRHPEDIIGSKYMTLAVLPDPGQETQQVQLQMPTAKSGGKSYD